MLSFFISFALTYGIFLLVFKIDQGRLNKFDYLLPIIPSSLIGCIVGMLVQLFALSYVQENSELVLAHTYELENMKDGNGVSGSFFLGCGNLASNGNFSYYQKNEDGSFSYRTKGSSNAVIIYSDNNPRLEVYDKIFEGNVWILGRHAEGCHYKFYVPEGSIQGGFELDAQ